MFSDVFNPVSSSFIVKDITTGLSKQRLITYANSLLVLTDFFVDHVRLQAHLADEPQIARGLGFVLDTFNHHLAFIGSIDLVTISIQ